MDNRTLAINRVKGGRSGVQALDRHKGEPLLDEVAAMREWLRERAEDGSRSFHDVLPGSLSEVEGQPRHRAVVPGPVEVR